MLTPVFPTQIGYYVNENHDAIKQQLLNFAQSEVVEDNEHSAPLKHFGQESRNQGLNLGKVPSFRDWVLECVSDYVRTGMGLDVKSPMLPINSWINVCGPGGRQFVHSHSNSLCCATYYVNFEPGLHSNLYFVKTQNEPHTPFLQIPYNDHYDFRTELGIQEGMLVVWPGHLLHGYDTNIGEDRTSLSMNFMPEVVMGDVYGFRVSPIE